MLYGERSLRVGFGRMGFRLLGITGVEVKVIKGRVGVTGIRVQVIGIG